MDSKRPLQAEEGSDPEATWNHPKRPRTGTFDNASHVGVPASRDEHYSHQLAHGDYTITWICALPLELAASRAMLNEVHPRLPNLDRDDNVYVLGRIHQHNVVMACLPGPVRDEQRRNRRDKPEAKFSKYSRCLDGRYWRRIPEPGRHVPGQYMTKLASPRFGYNP